MTIILILMLFTMVITGEIVIRMYVKGVSHSILRAFVAMTLLYVVPLSIDSYVGLIEYESVTFLLFYSTASIFFLYVGYLLKATNSKFRKNTTLGPYILKHTNALKICLALSIFLVSIIYCSATYQTIESIENILSAYLSAEDQNENKLAEKTRLWSMGVLSALLVMYVVIDAKKAKYKYTLSSIVFSCVVMVFLFMLLRGYRSGIALVFLAPLMYLLHCERWGISKFFGVAIVILLCGQLIDYVRAAGFENALTVDLYHALSIGEFGQTARGFDIYFHANEPFNYRFGTTYIWDAVNNMATTFGFLFAPMSTTLSEIGSGSGKMIGFGFSHQLESYINFGYFGPIFYIFIGIMFNHINTFSERESLVLRSIYYLMFPFLLIAQRIDFPVLFKIAAIPIIVLFVVRVMIFITKKLNRVKDGLHNPRQIVS